MANTKSTEKRIRQALNRRQRNRAELSKLRSAVKKVRQAVDQGDASAAQDLLPSTVRLLDRTASRGTIHRNAAARRKSRLVRAVQQLES